MGLSSAPRPYHNTKQPLFRYDTGSREPRRVQLYPMPVRMRTRACRDESQPRHVQKILYIVDGDEMVDETEEDLPASSRSSHVRWGSSSSLFFLQSTMLFISFHIPHRLNALRHQPAQTRGNPSPAGTRHTCGNPSQTRTRTRQNPYP
jgi:hypothetical protein